MSARRHEMYQDLDAYIERRRKQEPPTHRIRVPPAEEPPMEATTEYDETRESWWTRFKKSFAKQDEAPDMNEQTPDIEIPLPNQTEEDMKDVARIALIVLRRMTPEQTR